MHLNVSALKVRSRIISARLFQSVRPTPQIPDIHTGWAGHEVRPVDDVLNPFSRWTWVSRCLLKQRMTDDGCDTNNQHQVFYYKPDALPVTQPTVSKHTPVYWNYVIYYFEFSSSFKTALITTQTFSSKKFEIRPPVGSPPRLNWISTYLPFSANVNCSRLSVRYIWQTVKHINS